MSPFTKVFMSVLTAVVVGLSLRSSAQGQPPATAAAPAGVVQAAQAPTTTSAPPADPTPSPQPTRTPHRAATKAPTKAATKAAPAKAATKPAPSKTPPKPPSQVTVNGGAADTMYGPVQVQVTMRGTRIVSARAIDYPQGGGRDQEINSVAIPLLDQEAVSAQSAQIDTVSGATFTTDGYRRSLQSAIDAAHQALGR